MLFIQPNIENLIWVPKMNTLHFHVLKGTQACSIPTIWVSCPSISGVQWHPCTPYISADGKMTFSFKSYGNWTKVSYDFTQNSVHSLMKFCRISSKSENLVLHHIYLRARLTNYVVFMYTCTLAGIKRIEVQKFENCKNPARDVSFLLIHICLSCLLKWAYCSDDL